MADDIQFQFGYAGYEGSGDGPSVCEVCEAEVETFTVCSRNLCEECKLAANSDLAMAAPPVRNHIKAALVADPASIREEILGMRRGADGKRSLVARAKAKLRHQANPPFLIAGMGGKGGAATLVRRAGLCSQRGRGGGLGVVGRTVGRSCGRTVIIWGGRKVGGMVERTIGRA